MVGRRPVAPDGHRTEYWDDGSVHEVSEAFAYPLIRDGWAVNAFVPGPHDTPTLGPSETAVIEPRETKRKKQ